MDYREFVKSTIRTLEPDIFEMMKKVLVGEYLSFSIIDEADITEEILAEKLCDYFEKLELKTGKAFDKHIEAYINNIDSIVGNRVAKTPQPKKKGPTPVAVPRARKYYEKAMGVKTARTLQVGNLLDYTRYMMCLYAAIVENQYTEVTNFNFAVSTIDPNVIINAMKSEQDVLLKIKKARFNIKELYCSDTCTFIITIIALFKIIGDKVQGEYYHE